MSYINPKLPKHVAIIMDGNGRWANRRNLPRVAGHQAGAKAVKAAIEVCVEKNIPVLTLFAFGNENWGRPSDEVNFLMELFLKTLKQQTKNLHKNNVQLRIMGDYLEFNEKLQKQILATQQITAKNNGLKLVIAANYSGRWDILEAARRLGRQIEMGRLRADDITVEDFQKVLCLADLPEPDLLIRTSGEQRISNFMLWQFAYTEFYFTEVLWPDFTAIEFEKALNSFAQRQRRFGLTGGQVEQQQQSAQV
jgi:undecaprenyl diphosphate synthase